MFAIWRQRQLMMFINPVVIEAELLGFFNFSKMFEIEFVVRSVLARHSCRPYLEFHDAPPDPLFIVLGTPCTARPSHVTKDVRSPLATQLFKSRNGAVASTGSA
jgi:hypothetical protein